MANTFKFGNGNWAVKKDSVLAYNDENDNFKPLPFDFTRDSIATYVDSDGLIKTAKAGHARIDYLDNANGHLLLEPSRTNLVTYSNDFTQSSWSKLNAGTGTAPSITADYAISPDGTQNATRIVLDKGSGTTSGDYSAISATIGSFTGDGTFSVYLKSNTSTDYVVSQRIQDDRQQITVTSEWKRFVFSRSSLVNGTSGLWLRGGYGSGDYADILVWAAQTENASYATSYIPTNGLSVTRAADICEGAGNEQVINSTEGVLYAEIKGFISLDTTDQNRYIAITNDTSNERVALLLGGNTNQLRAIIYSSTQSINLSFTTSLTDVKQYNKLAVKYKSGDYAFFLNGTKINSSTETSIFSENTLNDLSFDVGGGTQQFRGYCKDLRVYNTALTDAELQALTQV